MSSIVAVSDDRDPNRRADAVADTVAGACLKPEELGAARVHRERYDAVRAATTAGNISPGAAAPDPPLKHDDLARDRCLGGVARHLSGHVTRWWRTTVLGRAEMDSPRGKVLAIV